MHTEYEIRVLEIDVDKIIKKLEGLNAEKVGEWDQRRFAYDVEENSKNKWIRLRTNGELTTLAYKETVDKTIEGTKEIEFEVKDFDTANEFLNKIGFTNGRYQENHRIRYILNGVELDIDSWPRIPTYLEIEGKSVQEVTDMVKLLGLENEKVISYDVQEVYRDYGIDIHKERILKF